MSDAEKKIAEFAKAQNISAESLTSLVEYLSRAAQKNPEIRAAMLSESETVRNAVLVTGVTRWMEESRAFYQELLENKTPRAQQYREKIYNELKAST